jgi:L-2,4-diaminobutyrate decarboxylase
MSHGPFGADAQLAGGVSGRAALEPRIAAVLERLARGAVERDGPVPAGTPEQIAAAVADSFDGMLLPTHGVGELAALGGLTAALTRGAADPADPRCAGHLHGPPLAIAVAAEVAAATLNPSLDSWDQGPAATALEPHVIRALAGLIGYQPDPAGGVMTSGGTESNLMGLLLARDAAIRRAFGADASTVGVAVATGRLRILCSELAHFSVQRNAALIGLGEDAVIAVPTDADHRMDLTAAQAALNKLQQDGAVVAAIVATAGSTDFGSIDPLPELAELAAEHGAWLHVDAAYGGGALLSDRLAPLLDGVAQADSVALDLHKLGWQPVPAGAFVTRRAESFEPLARRVAYLNPADDEDAGYPSLLGRSLRTTRRVDAFKVAVTFRALGRSGLGALVDTCHDLARYAAAQIAAAPRLELTADPVLTTVVFRYRPVTASDRVVADRINAALRRRLLAEGAAVVGRTSIGADDDPNGGVRLKLTLLNPYATHADVDALLAAVVTAGDAENEESG